MMEWENPNGLDLVVAGIGGRMGGAVCRVAATTPDVRVVLGLEHPSHPAVGGTHAGAPVAAVIDRRPSPRAVLVEFSTPDSAVTLVEAAAAVGMPAVSGTTGLDATHQARLRGAAARVPVVWAPNMSLGVNVLYRLAEIAVRALGPDFDAEIVELHHRAKRDAPSGTALRLAEVVARAREEATVVCGRHGLSEGRESTEVGVQAVRGGDIVGEHTLFLIGMGERLEVTHRASDRAVLARGALRAAAFALNAPAGFYSMADVLHLGDGTL